MYTYKKGQQREKCIREENEAVTKHVKGLYEGMVRAMKRVLMEEVAMRAIREYHGLQEGWSSGGQQARSDAEDAMNTSNARAATETENHATPQRGSGGQQR